MKDFIFKIVDFNLKFGNKILFKNADLLIQKSEFVFLNAPNGSGKSSLFKSILDFNKDGYFQERIFFNQEYSMNILGKLICYLPQATETIFIPRVKMVNQIFTDSNNLEDLENFLYQFNGSYLIDKLQCFPFELSKGELQLLALGSIFIKKELKLIILDEPTSFLDIKRKDLLRNYLEEYQCKFQTSFFIASHDKDFINFNSDRVYDIKDFKLTLLDNSLQRNSLSLSNNLSVIDDNSEIGDYIVKDLTILNSNKEIVSNLNFKFNLKENIIIIGDNGTGKTTLLESLTKGANHNYEIKGHQNISNSSIIIFQNVEEAFNNIYSVKNILLEAFYIGSKIKNRYIGYKEILRFLKKLNLNSIVLKSSPIYLSKGELQKILVIRSLLLRKKIILFDETFNSLDIHNTKLLINLLKEYQQQYDISYIIVTHNFDILKDLADYCLDLNSGNYYKLKD